MHNCGVTRGSSYSPHCETEKLVATMRRAEGGKTPFFIHICMSVWLKEVSPLLTIILSGKEAPVRRDLEPWSPCSHSPPPCSGDADTDHMTRWEKAPHLEGHKPVCSTYSLYCPPYRSIGPSSSERLVFRLEHGTVLVGSFLFMNLVLGGKALCGEAMESSGCRTSLKEAWPR